MENPRATTMTFAGIVACQIGTAFASRTERAALRSVGVLSNRLLLWGIAFELLVAALAALRHDRRRPYWAEDAIRGVSDAWGRLAGDASGARGGDSRC